MRGGLVEEVGMNALDLGTCVRNGLTGAYDLRDMLFAFEPW